MIGKRDWITIVLMGAAQIGLVLCYWGLFRVDGQEEAPANSQTTPKSVALPTQIQRKAKSNLNKTPNFKTKKRPAVFYQPIQTAHFQTTTPPTQIEPRKPKNPFVKPETGKLPEIPPPPAYKSPAQSKNTTTIGRSDKKMHPAPLPLPPALADKKKDSVGPLPPAASKQEKPQLNNVNSTSALPPLPPVIEVKSVKPIEKSPPETKNKITSTPIAPPLPPKPKTIEKPKIAKSKLIPVNKQITELNRPWKLSVRIVKGRTQLTATANSGGDIRISCDRLHLQRPDGNVEAVGKVVIVGKNFKGSCDRLTIAWHNDQVVLKGNAQVNSIHARDILQVTATELRLRLSQGQ